jgi:hypothetical protein
MYPRWPPLLKIEISSNKKFLFLVTAAILNGGGNGAVRHNFERDPPRDHPCQVWFNWSLDGPLPKLCPVIPTSNEDGHQAKNRKKGGWNFNCPLLLLKQQWTIEEFSIFGNSSHLQWGGGRGCQTQFWKGSTQGPSLPGRYIPIMQIRHILIKDHI